VSVVELVSGLDECEELVDIEGTAVAAALG
jgi:hypothetical protein